MVTSPEHRLALLRLHGSTDGGEATVFKRFGIVAALLMLAAGGAAAQTAKVNSVMDMTEFVQDWKISKQFTLDVAGAMPAGLYGFKANPEEMTFGEQMVHLAGANVFRFNQITGIPGPFVFDPAKPPASDKPAVLKMLAESFDYVIAVLPQITPEQLKRTWHIPVVEGPDRSGGPRHDREHAGAYGAPSGAVRGVYAGAGHPSSGLFLLSGRNAALLQFIADCCGS
jgi:hypothetical protein